MEPLALPTIRDTLLRYPGSTASQLVDRSGYSRQSVWRALKQLPVRCEMRQCLRSDNRPRTVPHWYLT